MPDFTPTLVIEDIATGNTWPIPCGPIDLSKYGAKPTIRAVVSDSVARMAWTCRRGGNAFADLGDWTDANKPFRLVPKDGSIKGLLSGECVITACPYSADKLPLADAKTVVLTIASGEVVVPPPSLPETKPTPVEQSKLIGRLKLSLSDLAHKVYADTKALIDPLKLAGLRVWFGTQDFASYKRDSEVAVALGYEAAGLSAIYCFAQDGMTPEKATNAPAWMVRAIGDLIAVYDANPATKGRTIRAEFGNEPDIKKNGVGQYWRGTIEQYRDASNAVYDAVKAKFGDRVQFIAAGFSWDVDTLAKIAPALKCDALAYHGYPPEIDDANMRRYVKFSDLCVSLGKPGIITEGSPGYGAAVKNGTKNLADWSKAWQKYLLRLEALPGITEVILFNAFDIGTQNSAGAVFTKDLKPTDAYAAVKAIVS